MSEEKEILVVTSKIKKFVKAQSGLSTSAVAIEKLSEKVAALILAGIENAKNDKRKTVLDRDIP
ncbi:MAG: hypothetical protein JNM63_06495 [Spirochaetia bacterium]|nr:hypothetical protein [Spirochaetia bacterium]